MELRKLKVSPGNKRGMTVRDLYPVILIIATVAILLAVIMMIMGEWTDTTNTKVGTVTNETSSEITNTTSDTVNQVTVCGFDNFAITTVHNATSGEVVLVGNYTTVSTSLGTWKLTDAGALTDLNGTALNVSYTYNYGGKDCEAMEDIVEDFTNFVPWVGIILLVIAAAIVLGVVISSFRNRRI